jgi:hypothetical protein
MEDNEVTQDEISNLPHRNHAAFAAACARIAWNGLTRRHWGHPPLYLEGVLADVERLARLPAVSSEEKAKLVETVSALVARADSEPGGQCGSALARSIREALAVTLLEPDAAGTWMMRANHANEAYRWALHATRIARLGAAVPAERAFLGQVRKAIDGLFANLPALPVPSQGQEHRS